MWENRPVSILEINNAEMNDRKNLRITDYFNNLKEKLKALQETYSKHFRNESKVLIKENTSFIKQEFDKIPYDDGTECMPQLNDILEELNRSANDSKLVNVMALSRLLKTYLICTNKPSSEVLKKINIKEIREFYAECKKYTTHNTFCGCRNACSELIDNLLVKLLEMLFKKK
ncbi:hypothetical protein THOM_2998 [Trachipleistophora hominis]|uniref:Uncharacterized protein n=1 Tax=Trachipleistophora hominis TaxID=72359 RepID=L7JTL8_TRAHO|nr:hypothetical protein THOM_2998 [Trachipleistophora hominis]